MIELGQNLPLVAETLQDIVRVQAAPDEFERDFFALLAVGADREIDGAEPAAADFAQHFVGTKVSARELFLGGFVKDVRRNRKRRLIGKGVAARVGFQQSLYCAPQLIIVLTQFIEQHGALLQREVRRGFKYFLNPGVPFSSWGHHKYGGELPVQSRVLTRTVGMSFREFEAEMGISQSLRAVPAARAGGNLFRK